MDPDLTSSIRTLNSVITNPVPGPDADTNYLSELKKKSDLKFDIL